MNSASNNNNNNNNNNMNSSAAGATDNQTNRNLRPATIALNQTNPASTLLTPSPSVSMPPPPTPSTQNLLLPGAAPIILQNHRVTFRVAASDSSISVSVPLVSTERMHVVELEDTDDSPPPEL